MRTCILAAVGWWILLARTLPGPAAQEAPIPLLVLGPESRFLEPARIEQMAQQFRELTQRYSGFRLVEPPQPPARLRQQARCLGSQPACLARLGKLAGAQRVLHCEVQQLPGKYLVDVSLVEVSSGKLLAQARGRAQPSLEALQAALLKGWVDVLGPAPQRQIKVYANVTGARVLLDGQEIGQTPLILTRDPGPGAHRLEILADGYQPFRQEVGGGADGDLRVEAVLEVLPRPAGPGLTEPSVAGVKVGAGKDEGGEAGPPTAAAPKPRAARPGWLRLADETPPAGERRDALAVPAAEGAMAGGEKKPAEAGAREPGRPFYRTFWFWTVVGVVVGGTAAGLAVGLAGGGSGIPDGKGRLVLSF